MNRHENNDPRKGQRERAQQDRLTRMLGLAVGVLVSLIAATLVWQRGLIG